MYRKYKKTNNMHHWNRFKTLRNKVINLIRTSKTEYYDKLETTINTEKPNSKLFWKTSKQILKINNSTQSTPTLIYNNETAETDIEKATMLNDYFASQSVVNDNNKPLPPNTTVSHEYFDLIPITVQDVKDVFDNLDVNKACGPDLMNPRLLKEGSPVLALPYSIVFNRSIQAGHFPSPWKEANVTPIHKKDSSSSPTNYRPISLLCQPGKGLERCVHKQLFNYVKENSLITPFQSGFIPGDSTTFQLIHTYHVICEAVDSGKEVRVVFCDISKAFDRVWHRGLLHKLRNLGCSERLLKWFSSYLFGRRQRVVLNGQMSKWAYIQAGVPQGSILGPLLFLVYINDIVNELQASVRLFADDTSLYMIVDSPNSAALVLNNDLAHITAWAAEWLVDFNASKTNSMLISRRRNPVQHPPLHMNGIMIEDTKLHKHLGLSFSNTCSWNEHISKIAAAAWSRLNLLRGLKFRLKRHSLEKMYFSYIRPLLEYSDSVWDNASTESKKQLDAVHIEAARIITGATKLCSLEKLFADLGWDSLQERRNKHKLMILYKIINGLTPQYLQDIMPPLVQETTSYNLRNSDDIRNPRANTNLFFNSFFPSTIRAWNNLSDDIKNSTSVSSFKYHLNRNGITPPKYFNAGSRKGQILHARLRMECSSLNSHLYKKNIVLSPSCTCGGFESTYHYLFKCQNYSRERNIHLPPNLHNFNTKQLLFGRDDMSSTENEQLFIQVQNYIIATKRFM